MAILDGGLTCIEIVIIKLADDIGELDEKQWSFALNSIVKYGTKFNTVMQNRI